MARAHDCRLPIPWAIAYKVRSQVSTWESACHAGEWVQSAAALISLIRRRSRCAQCGGDGKGLNATAAESQADPAPMSSPASLCCTRHEARSSATETCAAVNLGSARGCQVELEPKAGSWEASQLCAPEGFHSSLFSSSLVHLLRREHKLDAALPSSSSTLGVNPAIW